MNSRLDLGPKLRKSGRILEPLKHELLVVIRSLDEECVGLSAFSQLPDILPFPHIFAMYSPLRSAQLYILRMPATTCAAKSWRRQGVAVAAFPIESPAAAQICIIANVPGKHRFSVARVQPGQRFLLRRGASSDVAVDASMRRNRTMPARDMAPAAFWPPVIELARARGEAAVCGQWEPAPGFPGESHVARMLAGSGEVKTCAAVAP